ncbi:MAG: zinc ABC transporter substrate-binding protein [Rubrivivax sp.]|nr:zinc ABC transporter substrate-binding protein [Rubrivivax sp.]
MRRARAALALLFALASAPASAFTVFACEPEWAALARILLPQARIHVATHAGQDPHHIEARPALIAQLRSADLAVCTGAALESGWLPVLQQRAANAKARDVFFAADQVELIDPQPGAIGTPWAGDVHAEGNPHLHLDPNKLLEVANALAERLQAELPAEKAAIEQRRAGFERQWKARIAVWTPRAMPLKGQGVAAQHSTFGYLWRWLGMHAVADLEPRPGMAPTPGHLQRLFEGLRTQPPRAVVIASHQDARPARWLTGQLSAAGKPVPLLVLPATVGEDAGADELMRWMDGLIEALLRAR